MFEIKCDFDGANIDVVSIGDNTVNVKVQLRDTLEDWFYWCFKVENAGGKTLIFNFENENKVGYYGAAVSSDYKNWRWQYNEKGHQGSSFTYTFGDDENEVYFAHDMLYRPQRFQEFADENGLEIKTLCKLKSGREVPYVELGSGDEVILLTARHHACESTGSYVLEGVLEGLIGNDYFNKYRIICVPFVDYDGVCDGDQGKNRKPHDHNRDYSEDKPAIYESTAKIRELAETLDVKYAFDFHSPWHLGGENDKVFIPIKSYDLVDEIYVFSKIWESRNNEHALPHYEANDFKPGVSWNTAEAPTAAVFMRNKGAQLAFSVETPYFCAGEIAFSPAKAAELGRTFVEALKQYDLSAK